VEKYCTAGQATDGNIMRCMRIACWLPNATNIKSEYVILIAFPLNNGYTNAPQRYVVRTVQPVLLVAVPNFSVK